jgi:hypothetical protein
MNKLPLARSNDVVVQQLGKEILVYDLLTHKAYNLNETCSVVYNACDGKTTFSDLKIKHKFTDDIIFLALDELKKDNLIEADSLFVSPFVGMNRREVIRRVGLASMIALPVISSLVAPTAAMAQSGGGANCTSCTADSQCTSGNCATISGICKAGSGETAGPSGQRTSAGGLFPSCDFCRTIISNGCCSGAVTNFTCIPNNDGTANGCSGTCT